MDRMIKTVKCKCRECGKKFQLHDIPDYIAAAIRSRQIISMCERCLHRTGMDKPHEVV